MHTIPTKDRIGLITIRGEDYAIVDIGMRMLTPRELARAQGFPDDYILEAEHDGKPLSKSAQVRMIGNSVCPPLARALIEANFVHERQIAGRAA
jgi:DNA (cytosine-5)-methyltransferase 1